MKKSEYYKDINSNINGWEFDTPVYVIEGKGKWLNTDGTIHNIESIVYPPLSNGKKCLHS